ncbi:apolipoprotein N-acyltransferase [Poseidonibacter ostreae]|uniref:Apolipoprotein N-acyltransferase n=1 Tax=Poseidonibacter ostreae TaxID=2654171 RepID=A0A6L4WWB2_9BACT|nr:apolipoprotein N-acyltransferase [Poseidonibacter ostreae]KAB7885595.1 apolipoprotein N-acyltransferase [Poseidonibacter ostreae]KAB7891006.1 apolipoprotein N-acyltransferase [Poseidonibacter ostreae]KAB7892730.1 apolipoprotein N-acyltransferase [Poseidonibacter ostreae]
MFLVKRDNFNKNFIIKGLITAILLSAFIYLSYFDIEYRFINTILGLLGLYFLLTIPRKAVFIAGFATGILWCYWMAISLKYYDLIFLTPVLLIAIGFAYGFIFLLFTLYDKIYFRIIAIFAFTFIAPFGFNWMKFELLFIDSYLGTSKEDFALILVSLFMMAKLKRMKILSILPLLFAFSSQSGIYIDNPDAKISMPQLNIKQNLKWEKDYQATVFKKNFEYIDNAIYNKKDLVILPETAFPTILNKSEELLAILKNKSYKIDIITGSLYLENEQFYNATYYISNGDIQIAKKLVLVPFGEEIPLPKFFVDLINDILYDGAQDYSKAKKPTDFVINNQKFRNAICYEATTDKIFENLNDVKYMIATSNNAWFTPSIEPTLQKLLLRYYSKKYNVTIFHVVNGSNNFIFRP